MNRAGQVAGGLILLIIIGVLLINPVSAQPITAPAKITIPGVYELTADARGITDIYGISIECSNVVLDGGNHFLGGEGRDKSVGVYVNQYGGSITNITVKNLLLEKWQNGIDYKYVKGAEGDINLITACDIVDSEIAIHVEYSDYVQVIDNKITNCPTGINVEGLSTYTTLEKNTIKNSGLGVGITNSRYTTVEENNINTCSVYGLQVTDSEYTTLIRNGIGDNKYAAVMIENSQESDITGNTLTKTETGPVLIIGNEVRYASITDNYFGAYEDVSVDEVSSEIAWNSTQAPGTNILGGPYMGGNYWGSAPGAKGYSDTAPDEDGFGIADKPYQINEFNVDYLPLTHTTATKAPEDQLTTPAEEETTESAENRTVEEVSIPVNETEPINDTPSSESELPVHANNTTSAETPVEVPIEGANSSYEQPAPADQNQTHSMTPVQTPDTINSSIMNSSLTNAYPSEGTGDLPIITSKTETTSPVNQTPEPIPDSSTNETAPALVGYLVFNVTEPGYQVTLTTATGTEISLDQAEEKEFSVPVPVQGLVYTTYRVTCDGFVPVSGNLSPYPAPGQTVSIPITLIPESLSAVPVPSPPVVPDSPTVPDQLAALVVPTLINNTSEVTVLTPTLVPAPVNASQPSVPQPTPAEPVVVSNGVVSGDSVKTPHIIKASAGPGGSIFPAGDVDVLDGGSIAFILEPQKGRSVSYLVIDGIHTGPMSEYRFINVTSDHTIVAGYI